MAKKSVFTEGNWTRIPNSFVQRMPLLSERTIRVFLYLCMSVDGQREKKSGRPIVSRSQAKIMEATGFSDTTVWRAIQDLIQLGYIAVVQRRFNGYNDYEILNGITDNRKFDRTAKAVQRVARKMSGKESHTISDREGMVFQTPKYPVSDREGTPFQTVRNYQDVVIQDVVPQASASQDVVENYQESNTSVVEEKAKPNIPEKEALPEAIPVETASPEASPDDSPTPRSADPLPADDPEPSEDDRRRLWEWRGRHPEWLQNATGGAI